MKLSGAFRNERKKFFWKKNHLERSDFECIICVCVCYLRWQDVCEALEWRDGHQLVSEQLVLPAECLHGQECAAVAHTHEQVSGRVRPPEHCHLCVLSPRPSSHPTPQSLPAAPSSGGGVGGHRALEEQQQRVPLRRHGWKGESFDINQPPPSHSIDTQLIVIISSLTPLFSALFCFSPTTKFVWKISDNLITKRLDYKPESFNFEFFSKLTVWNWDTNFVHTVFRSRKKFSTTYAIVSYFCFFSPDLSWKFQISQKLSIRFS